MSKRFFSALALIFVVVLLTTGCSKLTSPSPLDGIWLVESIEGTGEIAVPETYGEVSVYWEFQNVLFRITTRRGEGLAIRQVMWGYPYFDRDSITFKPAGDLAGKAAFPVPGGAGLQELTLRYETAHGKLTLFGPDYTIHLVRR